MDPQVCWDTIVELLTYTDQYGYNGARDEIADHLENLALWITRGGALPRVKE